MSFMNPANCMARMTKEKEKCAASKRGRVSKARCPNECGRKVGHAVPRAPRRESQKGRACCPQRAATIQTAFNLRGVCQVYRRAGDSTPYLLTFFHLGNKAPRRARTRGERNARKP